MPSGTMDRHDVDKFIDGLLQDSALSSKERFEKALALYSNPAIFMEGDARPYFRSKLMRLAAQNT